MYLVAGTATQVTYCQTERTTDGSISNATGQAGDQDRTSVSIILYKYLETI